MAKKKSTGKKTAKKKTAKNKNVPKLIKIDKSARSFRSMATGFCTLLFDAANEPSFRKLKFNPFQVSRLEKPKKQYDKMCQFASKGMWCAIETHPMMTDSDGSPGLDLMISDDVTKPKKGNWQPTESQYLDLPSGKLMIVYEPEFFEEWYLDDFPIYEACDPETETLENREFCDATSYRLDVEPGTYELNAFVRAIEIDGFSGQAADLAILLKPVKRPKSFGEAKPLIPFPGYLG